MGLSRPGVARMPPENPWRSRVGRGGSLDVRASTDGSGFDPRLCPGDTEVEAPAERRKRRKMTTSSCNEYLILMATYGDRGATEISCDRPKGHPGKHSGVAQRRIGYEAETEEDVVVESRIYWD
jgi:hypothetical protein